MLFLLFQLGRDRYVIDAAQIAEILPRLPLVEIPKAPPAVAGAFNYHGAPVPVIDLGRLAQGRAAELRLSTRIIVVRLSGTSGPGSLLGLIAERATQLVRRDPAEFQSAGVAAEGAPYLGPVLPDEKGLIQCIEVDRLLPGSIRAALFEAASAPAPPGPS